MTNQHYKYTDPKNLKREEFNIQLNYKCRQSSTHHKNAAQGGKHDKPSMNKFDYHQLLLFKFATLNDGVRVHCSINHAIQHATYLNIEVPSAQWIASF